MNYSYSALSKTHNFELYWSNKNLDFGYLGISKNGSTNFKSHFNLSVEYPLNNVKHETIYACIRNPEERLISSILETTLRAHKNEEQLPSRNVPVDNKIYESILNFNIKDPKIFFIQFLDSIEKFGFYDAHFEPQFHFLFNKNGSERFNFKIFLLYQMSEKIDLLSREYNLKTQSKKIYHSRKKRKVKFNLFIQQLKINNLEDIDFKRLSNFHILEKEHPFNIGLDLNFDSKFLIIDKDVLENKLINYYKNKLLPLKGSEFLNQFLVSHYSQDLYLYNSLKHLDTNNMTLLKEIM